MFLFVKNKIGLTIINVFELSNGVFFNVLNIPLLNYNWYIHYLYLLKDQYILIEKQKNNRIKIFRKINWKGMFNRDYLDVKLLKKTN